MPLLKKPFLHPGFRYFSWNLNFSFRKFVENMVILQLWRILETDYVDLFQSDFRYGDETEMAFITLVDDLWQEQMECYPNFPSSLGIFDRL